MLVTFVWGLSLLVPEPGRYGLWIAAMGLSTAGIAMVYLGFDTIETQVSHFSERLGLFTILVLGETILGVSYGTTFVALDTPTVLVGGLGFAIAVAVWWLYFNRFDEQAVAWTVPDESSRWLEARQRVIVHIYSHYLVHGGIVAMGTQPVLARCVLAALFVALAFGWSERSPLVAVGAAAGLLCLLVAAETARRVVRAQSVE